MQKNKRLAALYWFLVTAIATSQAKAQLALDADAGTNIVDALGNNFTYGGSVLLPIVLAVLLIAGMIGLYKRLSRKAGVST